jgi:TonB-linked SusC/RagA family outer membrane protein
MMKLDSQKVLVKIWAISCCLFIGNQSSWSQDTVRIADTSVILSHLTKDRGYYDTEDATDAAVTKVQGVLAPTNSVDQFFQGSMAGVTAIQNNGQPGAGSTLQIRGVNTIAANSQPLYVIDGMPFYSNSNYATAGTIFGPAFNPLSYLNSDDIESITVLKDAASLSLYGARGSNGVVLIRTKRAINKTSKIGLKISGGVQKPIGTYDLANGAQFASFLNQAQQNSGLAPIYSNPERFSAGTDWQKVLQRDQAWQQNYELQMIGGSEKISFLLSGSYFSQQGTLIGSDLKRYSLRANVDAKINDRLILQNSFSFSRVDANTIPSDTPSDAQGVDVISGSRIFNPLLPLVSADGSVNTHAFKVADSGLPTALLQGQLAQPNPLILAQSIDSKIAYNLLSEFLTLRYDLIKDLSLEASVGVNAIINDENTFAPGQLFLDQRAQAVGTAAKMESFQFINQYLLKYQHRFSDEHQISGIVGYSTEGYRREFLAGESRGFENENLRFYSLSVGQRKSLRSDLTKWGLQSYLGRIAYDFKNTLSIALAARSDASSIFDGSSKLFPSLSGVWRLSQEPFFQNSGLKSALSLRAGYGLTGNNNIDPYSRFTILDQFTSALNGADLDGIGLSHGGNDALEVEVTKRLNVGAHLELNQARYQLDIDFYRNVTDNAFTLVPLSGISGFKFGLANVAEISNTGVELSLATKLENQKISWLAQLVAGYNKNNIESLSDGISWAVGETILGIDEWSLLTRGSAIGSFYGYKTDGLTPSGDQKYQDLNGDGVIDRLDKSILGQSLPTISLGLVQTFTVGSFDLNIHLHAAMGHKIANFNRLLLENPAAQNNVSADYLERAGKDLPVPRASGSDHFVFSDQIIEDGSYLRLKTIALGYTLPDSFTQRFAEAFRIYLRAENLWTLSGYSGVDPDVSHFGYSSFGQGVDLGGYPKSTLIMAGLNLTF